MLIINVILGETSVFNKIRKYYRIYKVTSFRCNVLLFIHFIAIFGIAACKGNHKKEFEAIAGGLNTNVRYLDSIEASDRIINDTKEGFFESITAIEIQIQMKRESAFSTLQEARQHYKEFLKGQVSNWTDSEKLLMAEVMNLALKNISALSKSISPDSLLLIKIKTGHYGNDVYYTRENCIFIPENIFKDFDAERQLPVMLHEIFHIISRYNPIFKDKMYSLIGFERTNKEVRLPSNLEDKLLTNPDGFSMNHMITLTDRNNRQIKAIPLISSKHAGFRADWTDFFDYLNFDLFEVMEENGTLKVKTTENGQSTIQLEYTPSFFTKIKDNTQYIIHPEEIMADNFMLAVLAYNGNDYSKFTSSGKDLILEVITILKS